MPSVLPKISTPRNLFFSHLPARVEASASGICRASDSISVMACSAVVIELPNGVFITMMPRAVAAGMSTLSTPMPARPITFRLVACSRIFGRDFGRRADREPVEAVDDRGELVLVLAEAGLEIDLDAAVLEDRDGGGRELVGNENFGHGMSIVRSSTAETCFALDDGPRRGVKLLREASLALAKAQSSHGVSASRSARFDGRAAPDPQARRRVAIGVDVVGDAFLVERASDAS